MVWYLGFILKKIWCIFLARNSALYTGAESYEMLEEPTWHGVPDTVREELVFEGDAYSVRA